MRAMPARFLTDRGKAALADAARAIEARSAAEVVVSIAQRASRQLERSLAAGAVALVVALAAALYVPYDLALHWILVGTALVGAGVAALVDALPGLRRPLGRRADAVAAVRRAAAERFLARGVHHTRGRTGLLVHLSLAERVCALVADGGVHAALAPGALEAMERELDELARAGVDAVRLAGAIAALADRLADALPRAADDENELPDEVAA
jgi:putative membrane protein